ncbi:hypothetical protein IWQ62_005587, partial [Dispira parvispora]
METLQPLDWGQHRFREDRSTLDATLTLKAAIQNTKAKDWITIMFDIKGAYDL